MIKKIEKECDFNSTVVVLRFVFRQSKGAKFLQVSVGKTCSFFYTYIKEI